MATREINTHIIPFVIIGAGETGIAMVCRLKQHLGFDQFRIFDRQSGIGGTWWTNRYPGVACDVPSVSYSFSFAPSFAPFYTSESLYLTGSDFVKYLHRVAARFKIVDKIQLTTDVTELRYHAADGVWEATLSHLVPGTGDLSGVDRKALVAAKGTESVYIKQEMVRAKIMISCVGILVEPNAWPASIPGREQFRGEVFHSARWREDVDFKGKDVVVVGTGCSAAQVVPSLFEEPFKARSVTQLMRTPPWVMPRLREPFGKATYARYARYAPTRGNTKWRSSIEASTLARTYSLILEQYYEMMTPKYSYSYKRRVFDSAWLESMNEPNFRLTTQPLRSLNTDGVVLGGSRMDLDKSTEGVAPMKDERLHVDIIVLANGFEAARWLHPLTVYGRGGKSLHDVWDERGGPQASMGTAMDGFPNFFIGTGPNTATGQSSLILGSENMVEYILNIIDPVLKGNALYAEVKEDAEIRWTQDIQQQLKKTVFAGCMSCYQDVNGWNSTMYPQVFRARKQILPFGVVSPITVTGILRTLREPSSKKEPTDL